MADINPDDIPFVPPANVSLIDTASDNLTGLPGGKPTTAFHDWLTSLWSWMKRSVVDLTTKITTLTDQTDNNTAEVEQITQALTDGTGAYGTYITSINTKANNATASGQVYLQAMSGPSGSLAAYGIHLTAGNVFTGLMLVAYSGGVSKIVMTSGALEFWDSSSGAQVNMLSYSGGEWVLNGNVTLQSASGVGTLRWANGNITIADTTRVRVALGINI